MFTRMYLLLCTILPVSVNYFLTEPSDNMLMIKPEFPEKSEPTLYIYIYILYVYILYIIYIIYIYIICIYIYHVLYIYIYIYYIIYIYTYIHSDSFIYEENNLE